ncbi:hypothetical protein [Phormidium sp. CCY1219]|uniref:hypothetical protein n=1 Tax=Phormidium sp. CCY1219 TaxID=2886104 RepID=UPI002D1EC265|nr:hypothetical protein [Phormidium sp. CCY1219]MEB3827599.1 hypothetical protein [Phormidium sp. CCY1219]
MIVTFIISGAIASRHQPNGLIFPKPFVAGCSGSAVTSERREAVASQITTGRDRLTDAIGEDFPKRQIVFPGYKYI